MNTEDEFNDIFQKEIVRELLLELDEEINDKLVDDIWKMCKGNPWDAVVLYQFTQILKK